MSWVHINTDISKQASKQAASKQASKQASSSKQGKQAHAVCNTQRERESVIAMLAVGAGSSEVHGYMQLCSLCDIHMQTFPDVYYACLGIHATLVDAVQHAAAIKFAKSAQLMCRKVPN